MPKKTKKSRQGEMDSFNLTGIGIEQTSVENCLDELEGSAHAKFPVATDSSTLKTSPSKASTTNSLLWDPAIRTPFDCDTIRKNSIQDRVRTWNGELLRWMSSGRCAPGFLPSLDVEMKRHRQVKELSSFLLKECPEVKMPTFERWLIDCRLEENQRSTKSPLSRKRKSFSSSAPSSDVLLSRVEVTSAACQRLREEIEETGISREKAESVLVELCHRNNFAVDQLLQANQQFAKSTSALKKGDRIEFSRKGNDQVHLVYHRKKWDKPFVVKINEGHYDKLKEMFLHTHNQQGSISPPIDFSSNPKAVHIFNFIVFLLLLRYSSLAGGQLLMDLRGGGMQGAIHSQVFKVLQSTFQNVPVFECFASPFNAYIALFGSAFQDLDWHFGSVGDFMDLPLKHGCFEANPPFSPGLMDAMVDHIEKNLSRADKTGEKLTFVIIVPTADEDDLECPAARQFAKTSFKRMIRHESCHSHVILRARQHGYIEGTQHMRPTRYKTSFFDTSVITLQSQAASKKEWNKQKWEIDIRESFGSLHQSELDSRKRSMIA